MKRYSLLAVVLVLAFTSLAVGQEPLPSIRTSARTVQFEVEIVDLKADVAKELNEAAKERGRLDRLISGGRLRPVAGVQIRTRGGEQATARIGQRVPVGVSSSSSNKIDYQYENTGLNVDITPFFTTDDHILVNFKIELSTVARGLATANPTFLQRAVSDRVRVKPNETAVILSVVQQGPLWPGASAPQPGESTPGNFAVFLTARLID